MNRTALLLIFILYPSSLTILSAIAETQRPNILWISSEDHGPHLGSYGDEYATTPNLDRFAENALRYTRASSTAPVCSPARTTIISGMYAPSTGSQHMRSRVPSPSWLKFFPRYLQEAGYYTTNNVKEDYNLVTDNKGWDESSRTAHWKNRPDRRPFFSVFNFFRTHESQIRNENESPVHDPALAPVPPYHPDTPEVRKDWAQYYDRLSLLDNFFQARLQELEDAGLAEDTIVIFFADHGSGMPRSKRYPGWSGLHVPLIVHVPEKFAHLAPDEYSNGGSSDRLVGFVDFAPTMLSLAGIEPPKYYQGSAFMGAHEEAGPKYSFGFRGRMDERPDFCRSAMDGRYIYIRNNMAHLPHGQYLEYQQQTPTTRQWYQLFKDGKLNEVQSAFWRPHPREELFDLESDPHETINLANAPEYKAINDRFSKALDTHMLATSDLGFYPEPILRRVILHGESPAQVFSYDFSQEQFQIEVRNSVSKYWNIIKLFSSDIDTIQAKLPEIAKATDDSEPVVAVAAAELLALYTTDEDLRTQALDTLIAYAKIQNNEIILTVHALNALDHVREAGIALPAEAKSLVTEHESIPQWASSYRKAIIDRF